MAYRNRSSKFRAVMSSPFTLVVLIVVFLFLVRAAWNMYSRASDSAERLAAAEKDLAKLEDINSAAAARVDRLSSEAGIRAEIRERYRAVEPGESVVVIVDPVATASVATTSAPESRGWWARLFGRD